MTHSLDDALVEKVARAIHDARFEGIAREHRPHPTRDYSDLEYATRLARAALEAAGELREENAALRAALALAVPIIELERDIVVSCNTVLHKGSPGFGKVVDADALEEIATYDEALTAARAALNPRQNEEEGE